MATWLGYDDLAMIEYRDDALVALVADTPGAAERAARAIQESGRRVAGPFGVAEALRRIGSEIHADAHFVEVEGPSDDLDRLLARFDHDAASGRQRSVVVTPAAMIDRVCAVAFHRDVAHLVDPGPQDRSDALDAAVAPRAEALHDVRRAGGALLQLTEDAVRLAHGLAALSDEEAAVVGKAAQAPNGTHGDLDAAFIRSIIRCRRQRDQFFQSELFADPAWDMLLDLMAARLEGSRVAVSSLCIAAAVPATTALRWIKTLTDHGLFVRSADPEDGRRVYIALSDDAARRMTAYLNAIRRGGAPTV